MKRIDQESRRLILQLHERGVSVRKIAEMVQASRPTVALIIRENDEHPPPMMSRSRVDGFRKEIEALIVVCRGNLVRVREELVVQGIEIPYSTLAEYVRKEGIGRAEKVVSGRYDFGPGEEMQHDTSPHKVKFVDGVRTCQCASLILHYSTILYAQYYQRFTRLECKTFLSKALEYFKGSCGRCMVDNSHVVIHHGAGSGAVITPEMESFSRHFGFQFVAHEVGHANRSAYVERYFWYIENNFLSGRVFNDFEDLNGQLTDFCDKSNHSYKRKLSATPFEIYESERNAMIPMPPVFPPVYRVFWRKVDVEGYVHCGGHLYSVPYQLVNQDVEIRESIDHIRIYLGPAEIACHVRTEGPVGRRTTDKAHRPVWGNNQRFLSQPIPQEVALRQTSPVMKRYVDLLRSKGRGRSVRAIKHLYRMVQEYPASPLQLSVETALQYEMIDIFRLERMVLRNIGKEHFTNLFDPNKEMEPSHE